MSGLNLCSNCAKPSERLRQCSGTCLGRVRFCSLTCQKENWKNGHRNDCKKIDRQRVLNILAALGRCDELVLVSNPKQIKIVFRGQEQSFRFQDAAQCKKYTLQYALLTTRIKDPPSSELQAIQHRKLLDDFKHTWGPANLSRRVLAHYANITLLLRCCSPTHSRPRY